MFWVPVIVFSAVPHFTVHVIPITVLYGRDEKRAILMEA